MDFGAITDLLSGYSVPVGVVAVLLGLANCFFGYRIFKFMLGVVGFLLGAAAGVVLGSYLGDGGELAMLIGGLVGGLIGAGLLVALYFLGVFLFGAAVGALLVGVLGTAMNIEMPTAATIVGAIILGIIAVVLQKVVIILSTALSGAWTTVVGVYALMEGNGLNLEHFWRSTPWEDPLIPLAAWLVLAVAGAFVQFRTTR